MSPATKGRHAPRNHKRDLPHGSPWVDARAVVLPAFGMRSTKADTSRVFHEYDATQLFATVDALFDEQRRMAALEESDKLLELKYPAKFKHKTCLPEKSCDEAAIVSSIFEAVTGKRAGICGTKLPGYHRRPAAILPSGVEGKTIHLTRHPHAVIASYVKKMSVENYADDRELIFDTALAQWISNWNFMIDSIGRQDFLHLLYESIAGDTQRAADRIASFLGIEADFDMSGFGESDSTDYHAQMEDPGFGAWLPKLEVPGKWHDWPGFAVGELRGRRFFGFPLAQDEAIDLTNAGNGLKYVRSGFYESEEQGAWIRGAAASLVFSPTFDFSGGAMLMLRVAWALEVDSAPPFIAVEFDGKTIADMPVMLGDKNGAGETYPLLIPQLTLAKGRPVMIRVLARNPRCPKLLGVSDDGRKLSVMIERVRSVPLRD